jgi:hypothetical protein
MLLQPTAQVQRALIPKTKLVSHRLAGLLLEPAGHACPRTRRQESTVLAAAPGLLAGNDSPLDVGLVGMVGWLRSSLLRGCCSRDILFLRQDRGLSWRDDRDWGRGDSFISDYYHGSLGIVSSSRFLGFLLGRRSQEGDFLGPEALGRTPLLDAQVGLILWSALTSQQNDGPKDGW